MDKKKTLAEDKKKTLTEAEQIWDEISNVQIDMFSLPDQTVSKYCTPITIEPSKLYVTSSVQSVVPALENAIGRKFTVERAQKYIIIARKKD